MRCELHRITYTTKDGSCELSFEKQAGSYDRSFFLTLEKGKEEISAKVQLKQDGTKGPGVAVLWHLSKIHPTKSVYETANQVGKRIESLLNNRDRKSDHPMQQFAAANSEGNHGDLPNHKVSKEDLDAIKDQWEQVRDQFRLDVELVTIVNDKDKKEYRVLLASSLLPPGEKSDATSQPVSEAAVSDAPSTDQQ
jgi:hypothetical protein